MYIRSLRTYLSLPKTTIPTLSVSKLRAIPLIPLLNSTISPAWTLVRPKTLAIPSPIEITVPNSIKSFYRGKIIRILVEARMKGRLMFWKRGTYNLVDA